MKPNTEYHSGYIERQKRLSRTRQCHFVTDQEFIQLKNRLVEIRTSTPLEADVKAIAGLLAKRMKNEYSAKSLTQKTIMGEMPPEDWVPPKLYDLWYQVASDILGFEYDNLTKAKLEYGPVILENTKTTVDYYQGIKIRLWPSRGKTKPYSLVYNFPDSNTEISQQDLITIAYRLWEAAEEMVHMDDSLTSQGM